MNKLSCTAGSGWLFDLYTENNGIRSWFITEDGKHISLWEPYDPLFYVRTKHSFLDSLLKSKPLNSIPLTITCVERRELQSGKGIPVLEVKVKALSRYNELVSILDRWGNGRLELFTCDIQLTQRYLWDKGLFPLAFCKWKASSGGLLIEICTSDDIWATNYSIPPLSIMEFRTEGIPVNPRHGHMGRLEILWEGERRIIEGDTPHSFLENLAGFLQHADPDVILSHWGDGWHLPLLKKMEQQFKIPLPLHRDPVRPQMGRQGKSYFSYGRIIRREDAAFLAGRWHLDIRNSFIIHESGLDGLIELARLSSIPVQQLARSSTGTVISAMQLCQAYKEGILIPWRKQEPEAFKTAEELISTDKGGLIFQPEPGIYGDVAELDFASLYPAIMAKYNISQETLGCSCCTDHTVPEIGRHTCRRRDGLIPRVLRPILKNRSEYKKRMLDEGIPAETRMNYKQRQTSLKWILVTCFGYLGYRNARFGRIEAHEAVTAYGRELLLQAKEIAEGYGYRLIHAIVDSVWVYKCGITEKDAMALANNISAKTGIPMTFEGIYRWLMFPTSRTRPAIAVPNRYAGVFNNGEIKVRGIELRRHDTPLFIGRAQKEIIETLSLARSPDELYLYVEKSLGIIETYSSQLRDGKIPPLELAISKRLTRRPDDYTHSVDTAIASQSLLARGVRLEPGEEIQIIITSAKDKDPASRVKPLTFSLSDHSYDKEKYLELLLRAAETILKPLGYDAHRLKKILSDQHKICNQLIG